MGRKGLTLKPEVKLNMVHIMLDPSGKSVELRVLDSSVESVKLSSRS